MTIRYCIQVSLAFVFALAGARVASAQCYQFSSGAAASLMVNITNLPSPTVGTDTFGDITYAYDLIGLSGNSVTIMIGGATNTATVFSPQSETNSFSINITSGPIGTIVVLNISSSSIIPPLNGIAAIVELLAGPNPNLPKGLLPNGLPTTLPPISAWATTVLDAGLYTPTIPLTYFVGSLQAIGACTASTLCPVNVILLAEAQYMFATFIAPSTLPTY